MAHPRSPAATLAASLTLAALLAAAGLPDASAQTPVPAEPQAKSRDIRVGGMGIRKCSEWLQWKEGQNGEARALSLEWAQGFIAGHNIYARQANNVPASSVVADTKVLVPLLDTYCQKYPDNRLLNGVIEITKSLGGAGVNFAPKPAPKPAPRPESKGPQES
jgi:hypothetical protein